MSWSAGRSGPLDGWNTGAPAPEFAPFLWGERPMNLSLGFDESARLATIHYAGEPSLEEWTATMLAAMNDPRFGPGVNLLLDRRLVGTPSSDFVHGVTDFIGLHRAVLSQRRIAILVGGIGAYGMARMGQTLLTFHGVEIDILESKAALEEWLRR